jgi:hypothetical protein
VLVLRGTAVLDGFVGLCPINRKLLEQRSLYYSPQGNTIFLLILHATGLCLAQWSNCSKIIQEK